MDKKQETNSYKGWLNSDNFIKRALAVMGYEIAGHFFVMLSVMVLLLLFVIIFGGMGMIFNN